MTTIRHEIMEWLRTGEALTVDDLHGLGVCDRRGTIGTKLSDLVRKGLVERCPKPEHEAPGSRRGGQAWYRLRGGGP